MAKQELLIIDALKKILPEASWSWAIPALRRSPLIWGKFESDGFLQYLGQEIGSEPTDWTPGRIGAAALNRESSELVDWPIKSFDDLPAGLRNQVNQTYQDYENNLGQILGFNEAFQLCLALFGEKNSGKTWQEILTQYSAQNSWLFALSCLFDLVDNPQDLIRALNPEAGMQVLLSRPLPPAALADLLGGIMTIMDPANQEKWIKTLNKEVPDLSPNIAKTLLAKQNLEPSNIQESVTLSLLNQLAGNTEIALELLREATDQNQKLHGKLAANLNKVKTDLQQPQVDDKAWQELTSTISSPEGMDDNAQEISEIIRSLLDNKYYTAAGDLISKIKDPLPEHPELLTTLAEYAFSQNQKTRARHLALLALEKGNRDNSPPANLSSVLLQLNLLDECIESAQSYLSKYPNHLDTHLVFAEALSQLGNSSLAAKQAQIASVLNPQDISLMRKMAEYQEDAEDWKDALETHANILSKFHTSNEEKSQPEVFLPLTDLYSFASCAYAAQQPKRAITACKQILDQQPNHSSAHALIGKSLIFLGKEDEGFAYLNQAVEISPDMEEPWIALAESQLASKTPERAIQTLKSGLTAASTRAQVLLKLGEIQANHLNQSKALETFQNAAVAADAEQVDQKTNFEIQYGLGRSYYNLGHLEQARITLKNLQEQYPAKGKVNAIYGKLLLDMDEPQEALLYLVHVVDQNPLDVEPYLQHADAHLRIGDNPDAAAESLNKALKIDPENKIAFALLGETQIATENYQDAIISFQKAYDTSLNTDPSWSPRISLGLGTAAIKMGKTETAIASLKEGHEKFPQDLPLTRGLAEAYQSANLTTNALKAAKQAAEIAPHDPETLAWIAEFTLALGSPDQGISALKELLKIEPGNHAAHIHLGKAFSSAGRDKEAFTALSQILQFEEIQPEDLLLAGDELIKLSNFETGMKCLTKAVNICEANPSPSPLLPKFWSRLAAGHALNNKPKQALELLDQAISADLDHPEWRIQKADLLIGQDRFQAAIASLSNALDLSPEDPDLHAKMARVQQQVSSNEEAFYHAQEALAGFQSNSNKKDKLEDTLAFAADLACATLRIDQAEEILSNLDLEQLKKGGELNPSQVHSLCLSGEISLDQNQEVKAAEISNLLVSMETDNPRVSALKARIFNRQGSLKEAKESFNQAVENWHKTAVEEKSFNTAVEIALGRTAQELHEWDESVKHIQHAADLNPSEKRVIYELALSYITRAEARRFSEAIKAIRHSPDQNALSNEVSKSFQDCIQALYQMEVETLFVDKIRTRGEAVFSPNQETAEALKITAETPEDLAALIAAFRHSRQKVFASQTALDNLDNLGKNALLDAQIALALLKNKPDKAYKAAASALELAKNANHSQVPLFLVLLGMAAEQIDDLISAEESIQKALLIWQDEPRWYAFAADLTPDYAAAVEYFRQAIELDPEYAGHFLALGKLHMNGKQPLRAIKSFEKAISIKPDYIDAWIQLSLSKRAIYRIPEALASINKTLALAPDHKETRKTAALLNFENGSYRESEKHLVSLLGQDPHDVDLLALFARTLAAQKQPDQALRVMDKAISLEDENLDLKLQRAGMIKTIEGPQAAIDELRVIGSYHPDQYSLVLELVSTLAEAGEVDQAVRTAQDVLQNEEIGHTRDQKAHLHLITGRMLRKSGQLDQAVHHLHKAKKLVDPNFQAILELGRVHSDRRQYEQALDQIQKAIKIEPGESEGYFQAGKILKELKQFEKAERMLRKASKLSPHDLKIHRQLGVLVTLNLVHGEPKKEVRV